MSYHGDIAIGSTIDFKFSSIDAGIPTSVSGAYVVAYPDNSTTEIAAGITFTGDFDSRVGLNNVRVAATLGNGYAAGSNYSVVMVSGTVGGKSLAGYVLGSFSVQNRYSSGGDPWSTPLPGSYTSGQAGHILASRMPTGTVLVGDKTGFSLANPQVFDLIGNISGTITNTLNVINYVNTSGSSGGGAITDSDKTDIAQRAWSSLYVPIRTLTTSAGDSIPPAAGDDVYAIRGDTFVWSVSGLDLTNVSKVQFSVKRKVNDADSESLIFSESGAGLLVIDGSVAQTPANSTITYVSGTVTIRVEAAETAKLDASQNYYDIQIIRTTGTIVSSPVQGNFHITWDSTRATS